MEKCEFMVQAGAWAPSETHISSPSIISEGVKKEIGCQDFRAGNPDFQFLFNTLENYPGWRNVNLWYRLALGLHQKFAFLHPA